jgi:Fur family ferric uptake transcriptional regulator
MTARPADTASPETLRERFARYLRDRRLPITRQRLEVAEAVVRVPDHPSAERIRRELTRRGVRVGTATVYRTLDLLVEGGLVREHDFGDGYRRFEPAPDSGTHEHLICQRCGKVVEFTNDRLERMLELIADEQEFVHRRHRLEIYGVCAACRGRDLAAITPGQA